MPHHARDQQPRSPSPNVLNPTQVDYFWVIRNAAHPMHRGSYVTRAALRCAGISTRRLDSLLHKGILLPCVTVHVPSHTYLPTASYIV